MALLDGRSAALALHQRFDSSGYTALLFAVLPVKRRSRALSRLSIRSYARTNAGFDSLHCGADEFLGGRAGSGARPVC